MTDAHPYAENGELEKNADTHPHEARKVPSWFPPGEEDGEAAQGQHSCGIVSGGGWSTDDGAKGLDVADRPSLGPHT